MCVLRERARVPKLNKVLLFVAYTARRPAHLFCFLYGDEFDVAAAVIKSSALVGFVIAFAAFACADIDHRGSGFCWLGDGTGVS